MNGLLIDAMLSLLADLGYVARLLGKYRGLSGEDAKYDAEMLHRETLIALRRLRSAVERVEAVVEMEGVAS